MNKICPSKCPSLIASGNAVVLDIRESFEYDQAHIESLHIPMAEVVEHIENLKKYPQIIVMCQSGKRAEAMVNFLETEFNLTKLKKYLSELVDFEYEYVNIDNEISIYFCNENFHKKCFTKISC
jgi:rhodanese-related sulfurtransferase